VNQQKYRDVLPSGYQLHWYELQSVLGRGAYGITYLATDKNLQQSVAIKEYLPNEFASRENDHTVHPITGEQREIYAWGLDRFLREARTLAKFKHHNIVRVLSVFEKNNTAYMIMEYEQGEDLAKILRANKNMPEDKLLSIFIPILDGLSHIHDEGFIHRDIKPSNIYIRSDESPVLIDFGSARQTKQSPTHALTSLVTYGYAPFEQYNEGEDKQGPWTDLYAMAASLYLAIVGKLPVDALSRGSSLLNDGHDSYEPASTEAKDRFSENFLLAVDNAMMFRAQDRPQNVKAWTDMLTGKIMAPPLPSTLLVPKNPPNASTALLPGDYVSFRHTGGQMPPVAAAQDNNGQDSTVVRATSPSQRISTDLNPPSSGTPNPAIKQSSATAPNNKKRFVIRFMSLMLIGFTVVAGWYYAKSGDKLASDSKSTTLEPPTAPLSTKKSIAEAKITALLQLAQSDIASQNILAPENNNARQRYLDVLAIDPNHAAARQGLDKVSELQASLIEDQLNNNFISEASKNITLLIAIAPNHSATLALQRRLEKISDTAQNSEIEQLLQQARQHFKKHRLIKPDTNNAFNNYQHVLKIDPNNKAANDGIQEIISYYQSAAEQQLEQQNYTKANRIIKNIEYINPDSAIARRLSDEVSNATHKQQRITTLLAAANRNMQLGNLTAPNDKNALYNYQQVLKLAPSNQAARQGVIDIEDRLKAQFDTALAKNNLPKAESLLNTMRKFSPDGAVTRYASNAFTEANKPRKPARPDIEVISEMIGNYKMYFESGNVPELDKLSDYKPGRKSFVEQFFNQYQSVAVVVSGVRYIGKEQKGLATISLTQLMNKRGSAITPGTWSEFDIVIAPNDHGDWKITW